MTKLSERPNADGMQPEIWSVTTVLLEALNCPRALTAYMLCKYGEWMQVAKLKATPRDYLDSDSYFRAAQASDFLRKWPDLPVKVDRIANAKKSWHQSEAECRASNIFLRDPRLNTPEVNLLLEVAADFVKDTLGPCPLDLSPRFGPGATVSDSSKYTTVLDKVNSSVTFTQEAADLFPLWKDTAWARAHLKRDGYYRKASPFRVVEGNCFFTVPKTALIDRACAKGPSLNVAYQLPVGRLIRERLRENLAMDLVTGQQRHQRLAQIGSETGEYATIDSERASDTQCYQLVKRLTASTPLWSTLLDSLREPKTLIDGEWVHLHKFSAMGNGYTFELETLVFLSLAYAIAWAKVGGVAARKLVKDGHISVYGDDVILPTELAADYMWLLRIAGFTVNLQKSYLEGEFRESCGGDYFRGDCVNTVKLSDEVSQPAHWFSLHNALRQRVALRLHNESVLIEVKNHIPRGLRSMYGPTFLGDQVLHGWYGPQVRAKPRTVQMGDHVTVCQNQWVGVLKVLSPEVKHADVNAYPGGCQLAFGLYTNSFVAPARRPTGVVKYRVTQYEDDYHVIFEDKPPTPPDWLCNSPFARYFGVTTDGSYVT